MTAGVEAGSNRAPATTLQHARLRQFTIVYDTLPY